MDVGAGVEGLGHGRVPRHVGENPQFDLGIVRVTEHPPLPGPEKAAEFPAQFLPDRDVLQIGLSGGDPAGSGLGLVEGGVDPPVRADDLE